MNCKRWKPSVICVASRLRVGLGTYVFCVGTCIVCAGTYFVCGDIFCVWGHVLSLLNEDKVKAGESGHSVTTRG